MKKGSKLNRGQNDDSCTEQTPRTTRSFVIKCTAQFVTGGDVPTPDKTLRTILNGWGRPNP